MRKPFFAYAKTKTQISFAVTAKLISAFVFPTRIVQSLYYLIRNIKPLAIFFGCTDRFVSDLVGSPETSFLTTRLICFRLSHHRLNRNISPNLIYRRSTAVLKSTHIRKAPFHLFWVLNVTFKRVLFITNPLYSYMYFILHNYNS